MKKYEASLLNPNFYSNLGLAHRARATLYGESVVKQLKQCKLICLSNEASIRKTKEMSQKCEFYGIDIIVNCNHSLMNQAVGKANVMAIGIMNDSFKSLLLKP